VSALAALATVLALNQIALHEPRELGIVALTVGDMRAAEDAKRVGVVEITEDEICKLSGLDLTKFVVINHRPSSIPKSDIPAFVVSGGDSPAKNIIFLIRDGIAGQTAREIWRDVYLSDCNWRLAGVSECNVNDNLLVRRYRGNPDVRNNNKRALALNESPRLDSPYCGQYGSEKPHNAGPAEHGALHRLYGWSLFLLGLIGSFVGVWAVAFWDWLRGWKWIVSLFGWLLLIIGIWQGLPLMTAW
jgi:hypothetical protein